jgi:hypothetical protein
VTRTEPARVDVGEPVAAVELEAHAGVRRLCRGIEQQRTGHTQVHQQVTLVRQHPVEVLAKAGHPLDDGAPQPILHELGKLGPGPAKVEDLDVDDRPPLEVWRQLAADRLNLG